MPSPQPLPTVEQLVQVATGTASGDAPRGALQAERLDYGDGRSGSIYNHTVGPAAILWHREARRDRDMFRDTYFDDADGWALSRLVQGRTKNAFPPYGIQRILDTFGTGTCTLARSNSGAGASEILQGTRIQVVGLISSNGAVPFVYQVAEDTPVTGLSATVPIEAMTIGSRQALSVQGSANLTLLDPCYDPLWTPTALICNVDGTDFESAQDYRARVRSMLLDNRKGYVKEIVTALQAAGATYVICFASTQGVNPGYYTDDDTALSGVLLNVDTGVVTTPVPHQMVSGNWVTFTNAQSYVAFYLDITAQITVTSATTFTITPPTTPYHGSFELTMVSGARADYGLNAIYVGDANYQATPTLLNACTQALEGLRSLGDDVWVGGIAQSPVSIVALISLRTDPGRAPLTNIRRSISQALLGYFAPTTAGFTFKSAAIQSVIASASPYVQTVNFTDVTGTNTYSNLGIFVGGQLQTIDPTLSPSYFPATLPRYTLAPNAISLYFIPPI